MPKYSTQLVDREKAAPGFLSVRLKKPAGMNYLAGQNINIKLPDLIVHDPKGQRRTFTLSSTPHEEHLSLTMRLTDSGFKKSLKELPVGTSLDFNGPNGRFYLYEHIEKAIMIAGGIGITPFKSMIQDVSITGRPVDIHLFYSNSSSLFYPYHELFLELSSTQNFQLKYTPTLTQKEDGWKGCTGRIDMDMIKKCAADYLERDFFICGPPTMVDDIKAKLLEHGIKEEKIHFESFYGY